MIFNFALGFANTIPLVVFCRGGTGLFASISSVCLAFTTDTIPDQAERSSWFGWFGSAVGIGTVVGPIFGGVLADYPMYVMCSVAGGLMLIGVLLCIFFVKESLPPEKRRPLIRCKCLHKHHKKQKNTKRPNKKNSSQPHVHTSTSPPSSSSSQDSPTDVTEPVISSDSQCTSSSDIHPPIVTPKSKQAAHPFTTEVHQETESALHPLPSSSPLAPSPIPSPASSAMPLIDPIEHAPTPPSHQMEHYTLTIEEHETSVMPDEEEEEDEDEEEEDEEEERKKEEESARIRNALLKETLTTPGFILAVLNYFTSTTQFSAIQTILPSICIDRYDYGPKTIGFVTMMYGIGMVIIQIFIIPCLVPRTGEKIPLICGVFTASLALLLSGFIDNDIALWPFSFLFGLGQAFVVPTSTSIFSYFGDASIRGTILGIGQCMQAASRAVTPLICSALYDEKDWLPYLVVSIIAISGVLTLVPVTLRKKNNTPAQNEEKKEEEEGSVHTDAEGGDEEKGENEENEEEEEKEGEKEREMTEEMKPVEDTKKEARDDSANEETPPSTQKTDRLPTVNENTNEPISNSDTPPLSDHHTVTIPPVSD